MSEAQIIRDTTEYIGAPALRWTMLVDDETVSQIWVAIETSEIVMVETAVGCQGRGYASALYRAAASEMAIYHAPEGHRTPEGDRFARAVGGPVADSAGCGCYGCTAGADFDEED